MSSRTFQITATFASLTALQNVQVARLSHVRRAFALWARTAALEVDEARALLEQVGLADQAERPAGVLAYGDLKKLELAVALANDPEVLLLDEPTAGMAPAERGALMALTERIARERGLTVLFTEHDMDVVFARRRPHRGAASGPRAHRGPARGGPGRPRRQHVYLGDEA